MNFSFRFLLIALLLVSVTNCKVGPSYERPRLGEPPSFRFSHKDQARFPGDLEWRTVFKDHELRGLIEEALVNNLDLKSAVARVLQAQANLVAVHSRLFPSIGAGYEYNHTQVSSDLQLGNYNFPTVFDFSHNDVGIGLLQYEVDFWGKIRGSSEAAQARLIATKEGRRTVEVGLISAIATAYIIMREQDYELNVAKGTLDSRRKSLELISARHKGGQSPLTDVHQAEVLIAEADAAILAIEKQIALLENQLSILAGRAPGSIRRGQAFLDQNLVSTVPAGLPSDLLRRRPDICAAEQVLIAATANIGVAKAQLFPSFTLTASAGFRSKSFSDLFEDPSKLWQIGPGVSVPIFSGGRLLAGIRGSKAARDEAEADYRKTVLQGLREVSDALISRQKSAGFSEAKARVVNARQAALELLRERYDNGAAAYLEVLYNDQELFAAKLEGARAKLEEYKATIELYRAIGGGWDK